MKFYSIALGLERQYYIFIEKKITTMKEPLKTKVIGETDSFSTDYLR